MKKYWHQQFEWTQEHLQKIKTTTKNVKRIKFTNTFNQLILPDLLPSGLISLYLGYKFNQSLHALLPNGLTSLYLGHKFNQSSPTR